MSATRLRTLIDDARGCRVCAEALPHDPRPMFSIHEDARLLLIGQAPGAKVHAFGMPWTDASGRRLRDWLALHPSPRNGIWLRRNPFFEADLVPELQARVRGALES